MLHAPASVLPLLHHRLHGWYAVQARPLPWRGQTSPWGIFLSEMMSHQTPLARVEPVWQEWLGRWPTPTALAGAAPGEAVRAWGRLGYPRRALRLHEAARLIVERHGGQVPESLEALRALPGVGGYTAAAVASFAFGVRAAVVDTNVRRVLVRALTGKAHAAAALTRAELELAESAMPPGAAETTTWNAAVMELGALVCTSRAPRCGACPVADLCAWNRAGQPAYSGPARRGKPWRGTDRQARGALLAVLRAATGPVPGTRLALAWPPEQQRLRCLDSLVTDGLVEPLPRDRFQLPA